MEKPFPPPIPDGRKKRKNVLENFNEQLETFRSHLRGEL